MSYEPETTKPTRERPTIDATSDWQVRTWRYQIALSHYAGVCMNTSCSWMTIMAPPAPSRGGGIVACLQLAASTPFPPGNEALLPPAATPLPSPPVPPPALSAGLLSCARRTSFLPHRHAVTATRRCVCCTEAEIVTEAADLGLPIFCLLSTEAVGASCSMFACEWAAGLA